MRAWLILSHDIAKMCRSLSGKLNHHNLQSSQRNLICKTATQNLSKQKDRRKVRRPVISTQLLWSIDISRIFFTNENPRKFVEKQKMIFFYIFHVYLDNSKRTITQGTSAPEDFLPRGNFWPRKFSPRRLLSKKDPLCQGDLFVQEDVYLFGTIVQRHLCNKEHPMAKYVVWSRVLTKQKSDTWWLF